MTHVALGSPTVSVVMNCRNCAPYVREAVESVYAQTFDDWEIVFWDNASDDGSGDIARQFDGRLRYWRGELAVPLGTARNLALERARGEFIALLDCDDVWRSEKLERQMRLFARSEVGVVYTDAFALYPGADGRQLDARPILCRGRVLQELFLRNFAVCSSLVLRRSVIEEVGPFDPELNLSEEYDLLLRMAEHSEFDYVAEPLTLYRYHPQNSSWSFPRMQREGILVIERAADRTPALIEHWGRRVWTLKRAGLFCTPGEAYLLDGRISAARKWYGGVPHVAAALPRVSVLLLLSLLTADRIAALNRQRMELRRQVFMLRSSRAS